ncbi:MAG: hypothetical protein WAN86_22030 [Hyphomicrobiaceae bacterium]
MGLDIYHLRANAEGRGLRVSLEDAIVGIERMQRKFAWCLRNDDLLTTDWHKTLAALGVDAAHYEHTIAIPVAPGKPWSGQKGRVDGLRRRPGADAKLLPELLFVTNLQDEVEVAKRVRRGWGAEAVVLKAEFVPGSVRETVVYGEEIGCQRNEVAPEFYSEFPPSEFIVDIDRVRRIHELTLETSKETFAAEFLDTWNDETSFVFVGR